MFTGIIQTFVPIRHMRERPDLTSFRFAFDMELLMDLRVGASVSVDGVCLTVSRIHEGEVTFDAMEETLRVSTLGQVSVGDHVNVERSAKAGSEIGGHAVSGHIDGKVRVIGIRRPENNLIVTFRVSDNLVRYIFNKGFIALNGASLTVSNLNRASGTFDVYMIPETLRLTTFGEKQEGDWVNIEIDRQTQVIVDTISETLGKVMREMALEPAPL